jgi:hypothetical protein
MTIRSLAFRIARGLVLIALAGFAVLQGRSYLTDQFGPAVFQLVGIASVFAALWLGAGDLIEDLRKEQKNAQK